MEPGGFGDHLGNDVPKLRDAIDPTRAVLEAARDAGVTVIYTREGHEPNLADCPQTKRERGNLDVGIGDEGPMGRVLVRGQPGHEIVPELEPRPEEPVVDKPGKGSFYATDLDLLLDNAGIENLIITGVTTEVCVHTTIREANDRGYECLLWRTVSGRTSRSSIGWSSRLSKRRAASSDGSPTPISSCQHLIRPVSTRRQCRNPITDTV